VLNEAPNGVFSLEQDLMAEHMTELAMYAAETSGYFVDMGIPEDLERARRELA
jgi:NDP-sugar pyrophosphorylase family protein